eukprot:6202387-Pleurochrysis_carterae.AAC.1
MYIRRSGGVPLAGPSGNSGLRLPRLISLRGGYPPPAFSAGSDDHHEQAHYPSHVNTWFYLIFNKYVKKYLNHHICDCAMSYDHCGWCLLKTLQDAPPFRLT